MENIETIPCRVCESESKCVFSAKLLGKYNIFYFRCQVCGYLQTEEPYWLEEAYSSMLPSSDDGVLRRNLYFADKADKIIRQYFNSKGIFLDFAGGYGILTRLMRDKGFNFFHYDPMCKNLFGFEAQPGQSFELITALEVFEHFANPLKDFQALLAKFPAASILFTTENYPADVNLLKDWWYLCPTDGQHIGFLSQKTLAYIASKLGMNYYSAGTLHLLTIKKIPNPLKDSLCSILFQKAGKLFLRLGKLM